MKPRKFTDGTVCYGNFCATGEPESFQEALEEPRWKEAMQQEYDALLKNKTHPCDRKPRTECFAVTSPEKKLAWSPFNISNSTFQHFLLPISIFRPYNFNILKSNVEPVLKNVELILSNC